MGKLKVDENNMIVCPCDEKRLVSFEECKDCMALSGSDDDILPSEINCDESWRIKGQGDE